MICMAVRAIELPELVKGRGARCIFDSPVSAAFRLELSGTDRTDGNVMILYYIIVLLFLKVTV